MSNEEQLLIKDLCARLPYGVMVDVLVPYGEDMHRVEKLIGITNLTSYEMGWHFEMAYTNKLGMESRTTIYADNEEEIPKPYLRPMLSMTEEELDYLYNLIPYNYTFSYPKGIERLVNIDEFVTLRKFSCFVNIDAQDFFNAHHLDYRDLISKDLAHIALEGMYDIK